VLGRSSIWDSDHPLPLAAHPRFRRSGPDLTAYLALLRLGVTVPRLLPAVRWALTPPFHPYPPQSALWSSDFPRPAQDGPRPPRPTNLKQDTVQDGVREAGVDAPFGLKLTRSTNAVDARDSMLKPV
jgi:hypothetical protein